MAPWPTTLKALRQFELFLASPPASALAGTVPRLHCETHSHSFTSRKHSTAAASSCPRGGIVGERFRGRAQGAKTVCVSHAVPGPQTDLAPLRQPDTRTRTSISREGITTKPHAAGTGTACEFPTFYPSTIASVHAAGPWALLEAECQLRAGRWFGLAASASLGRCLGAPT